MHKNLSAYAFLFGNFYFNETPLVPPGIENFGSLEFNRKVGFVIRLAMENYHCFQAYFSETLSVHLVDVVAFFLSNVKVPKMELVFFLVQFDLGTQVVRKLVAQEWTTKYVINHIYNDHSKKLSIDPLINCEYT